MTRADTLPLTLSAWLRDASARLGAAGCTSPRSDAERLAAHGLGTTWSGLWSRMSEAVLPEELARLDELCERRARREPLAYLEGTAVFCGLELACGPGVLVPRPETETLVDVALELIAALEAPSVVDVGTGTGAVALAIASRRPDATVVATELSEAALGYARANVERYGAAVSLVRTDLLAGVRSPADLVVSNPPYVARGADLPPEVRSEPPEALFAGPQGDDVLLALLDATRVRGDRRLALEVGTPEQAARIADVLGGRVRTDHLGRPRVVHLGSRASPVVT